MAAAPKRGFILASLLAVLLLAMSACSSGNGGDSGRSILITANDGIVLHGRFYSKGASISTIILAHAYDSNQKTWNSLVTGLSARGYNVLTFDLRGHGDSPGNKAAGIADADLTAAYRVLADNKISGKVFIIGAELGGTAALKVAAREQITGVVTLSAPVSQRGLSAAQGIANVAEAKLFIAAKDDAAGAQAAQTLYNTAQDPRQLTLVNGKSVGTDLLKGNSADQVRNLIFSFLDKNK